MNKFKGLRGLALFFSLMAALLLALTGCQPVGGVDIGKVLISGLSVNSAEGQGSLSIAFELNEDADLNSDDARILKLLNPLTITIDESAQSSALSQSVKGSIGYSKGKIPFELYVDQGNIALQIEGVERPIVLDMMNLPGGDEMGLPLQDLQKQWMPSMQSLMKAAGGFFIKNAPNPNRISVETVKQTIHGESVDLHKIHAEIYGDELLELVKQTLQNILNDDEGRKELLGQLYDVIVPILQDSEQDEFGLNDVQMGLLSNKALAVGFLDGMIKQALQPLLDDFDNQVAELDVGIFNKENYFKIDYYADRDLNTRKSEFELRIEPQSEEAEILKAVTVTGAVEIWNLNGEVTADAIDTTDAITLDFESNPVKYLQYINHDSQLYKLLKNDLQVTRKKVVLNMGPSEEAGDSIQPYIKHHVTLVPARFLSEQLNAEVQWDGDAQVVTIIDLETGKTILITIGSDEALVDGRKETLELQAEITNGSTFLPLRFIAEQLGGNVHWNEDAQEITITKN